MPKNICGVCKVEFNTDSEYIAHICTDGFTPANPDHLGEYYKFIQQAALKRGSEQ